MLNRQNLESDLLRVVTQYNNNNDVKNKVIALLEKKNFEMGNIVKIFNQVIPFQSLSETDLCVFAIALNEAVAPFNESIDLTKYFSDVELEAANTYKLSRKREKYITLEHVFRNPAHENEYNCGYVSYKTIANWYNNMFVQYNPATQRELTIKEKDGQLIRSITLNPKSVEEITELMVNRKFTANAITFNVLATGLEKFNYDEEEKVLTIDITDENTKFDIIDGFHRSVAICRAVKENPDLDEYIEVRILNYSVEQAQDFIVREDKRNAIKKSHLQFYNQKDNNMMIAKDINNFGNEMSNVMFNKFAKESIELRKENKYVLYSTFASGIKYNFSFKTALDIMNLKKYLVDGLNYIVLTLSNNYTKENSYVFENGMFLGYLAMLKNVQGDDWMSKVDEMLNNIDFSKSNVGWQHSGILNPPEKLSPKRIASYFENLGGGNNGIAL